MRQSRVRAYKPKATTGCKTCRIRRIKCDEAKPHCKRCTNTGRRCDGYCCPIASSHSPSSNSCASTATLQKDPISTALHPSLFTTTEESRSFFFFREQTVPQISRSFDVEFWHRIVLQASHHELAIRHAACALGALHEKFEFGSITGSTMKEEKEDFALQQYLKAISYLLEPMNGKKRQAADVALITCVLFICFEALRGNQVAAMSHIDGGVKIISELQLQSVSTLPSTSNLSISSVPYIPHSALNLIFFRLDTQAASLISQRKRTLLSPYLDYGLAGYKQTIPSNFSSIEEARNSLDYIHTAAARSVPASLPTIPSDPVEMNKLELKLELLRSVVAINMKQWDEAFILFVRRNETTLDESTRQGILILRLHRILMGTGFKVDSLRALHDETAWDVCKLEFEAMVSLGVEIITNRSDSSNKKKTTFSFDTGVIFPLYVVAVKCRDHHIRRRAIELLKGSERVEGILNSLVTARVAERLVTIEEGGLGDGVGGWRVEDVASERRVTRVEVRFATEERKAYLRYERFVGEREENGVQIAPLVVVDECLRW